MSFLMSAELRRYRNRFVFKKCMNKRNLLVQETRNPIPNIKEMFLAPALQIPMVQRLAETTLVTAERRSRMVRRLNISIVMGNNLCNIGLTQNSHTPPAEDGSAPLTRGELRRLRRSYRCCLSYLLLKKLRVRRLYLNFPSGCGNDTDSCAICDTRFS